jgi:hypothetical protein
VEATSGDVAVMTWISMMVGWKTTVVRSSGLECMVVSPRGGVGAMTNEVVGSKTISGIKTF